MVACTPTITGGRYTVRQAYKNGPSIHLRKSDLRLSELMGAMYLEVCAQKIMWLWSYLRSLVGTNWYDPGSETVRLSDELDHTVPF